MKTNEWIVVITVMIAVAVIVSILTVSLTGKVVYVQNQTGGQPVYNTSEINTILSNLTRQINSLNSSIANLTINITTWYRTGNLYAMSYPSTAYVYIDGNTVKGWFTPVLITNLTSGNHLVRVTKTGFKDYYTNITIIPARTSILNATLIPAYDNRTWMNSTGNFTI